MTEVIVFGTIHIDRLSKVTNELDEFADSSDILLSEKPPQEPTKSDKRNLLVWNPSIYVMGVILDLFWGVLGFFFTGQLSPVDKTAIKKVANDRGIDIEGVDLNIPRLMAEVDIRITLLSWFWFVLIVVITLFGTLESSTVILFTAFVLAFLPIEPASRWSLSKRDEAIAENVEEILSSSSDINKGCLVVGSDHMEGVIEQLEENSVEVSNTHKSKWLRRSL